MFQKIKLTFNKHSSNIKKTGHFIVSKTKTEFLEKELGYSNGCKS